jgi:hypothetical protein
MKFERLSKELVELFIDYLRHGHLWNNGLVGSETLRYAEGVFISEFRDIREPEMGPYVRTYSEEELRQYLRDKRFPDYVYRPLVKTLKTWQGEST